MKHLTVFISLSLMVWSCTNSGSKRSIERSEEESQLLQKITNADFSEFVGSFTFGKFPFNMSETPIITEGKIPDYFYPISKKNIKSFLKIDEFEPCSYFTGYAIFEAEYIILLYYQKSLSSENNYPVLQTFKYDGSKISSIHIGECYKITSGTDTISQKIEGMIFADKNTSLIRTNYLDESPTGSYELTPFTIKPDGEIINPASSNSAIGKTGDIKNANTQQAANDPYAAEFENARRVADSIKNNFESLKHSFLKISYAVIDEGKKSWTCYFDPLFKMKYVERQVIYDENVVTSTYDFYNPEGMILWYQVDQNGNNSNIFIRLNQHIYKKEYDTEKNAFNYSMDKGEGGEPFAFKDQQVAHKLITTESNTQVQVSAKLNEIPKEEFTYDSDSTCYRLSVQKGEKGEFDSFWSELRVDRALFVHLFGDK